MAIDPNWVRENPEEAARQMDVLGDMHVDHVRHLWETRGFGGCVEFAEAFDALVQQKTLLIETCNMGADLADDVEQLTRERDQYRAAEEAQIALREKMVSKVAQLESREAILSQKNTDQREIFEALIGAKLEALPAGLKNRFVIMKMTGDIDQEQVRKIMPEFKKHTAGCLCFVNTKVDLEAINMAGRDLMNQAKGAELVRDRLREKANNSRKEGRQQDSAFYHRCANVADNKAKDLRRLAAGGA